MTIRPDVVVLLDIHDIAEAAEEEMDFYWPQLESVLDKNVMMKLEHGLRGLQKIQRAVEKAVGGAEQLVHLQCVLGKERRTAEHANRK